MVYATLAEKIGRNAAFSLCLHGDRIDAATARNMGLVDTLPEPFSQNETLSWVASRLDFLRYYRDTRGLIAAGQAHRIPEVMHHNRNADQTLGNIRDYLDSIRRRKQA